MNQKNESHFLLSLLVISVLAGTSGILSIFYFDQPLSQALADPSLLWFRRLCREITDVALSIYYFAFAAFAYVMARWVLPKRNWRSFSSDRIAKIRRASTFSFQALFVSGLLIHLVKIAFGRQRPHRSEIFDALQFDPWNFHWHWHSFPSGHSQVIFVVGTLLSIAWPKYRFWFLLGAFAIAFTRVPTHQHFLSDVIVGSAIGYLVTIWLYRRQTRRAVDPKN